MTTAETTLTIRYQKLGGCLSLILFVCSFGVANLAIWLSRRSWPATMDDTGVTLFNGKRHAWCDIRRVEHLTTDINGTIAHKFIFHMQRGRWELPHERLVEPQRVLDFITARLPANTTENAP